MASTRPTRSLGEELWRNKTNKMNAEFFVLTYGAIVKQLMQDHGKNEAINTQLDEMGYRIGVRLIEEFIEKTQLRRCRDFRDVADAVARVAFKMFLNITPTISDMSSDGRSFTLVFEENPIAEFVELPPSARRGGDYAAALAAATSSQGVLLGGGGGTRASIAGRNSTQSGESGAKSPEGGNLGGAFDDVSIHTGDSLASSEANHAETKTPNTAGGLAGVLGAPLWYSNIYCGIIRGALEMVQFQVEARFVSDVLLGDDATEMQIRLIKVLEDEIPPGEE